MTDSSPKSEGSLPIGYELSPRARAYFDARPERRDPKYICSEAELVALLERHGLPVSPAILEFERNFGGWSLPAENSTSGYGVVLSLEEGNSTNQVARHWRSATFFSIPRGHVDEDEDEPLAIHGSGFPRAFFLDHALVPIGMHDTNGFYFMDSDGRVYLYASDTNEFECLTASVKAWLELRALRSDVPRDRPASSVIVYADVGSALAATLDASPVVEVTDEVRCAWIQPRLRIEATLESSANPARTSVLSSDSAEIVNTIRFLKRSAPDVLVLVGLSALPARDFREVFLQGERYVLR